MRAGRFDIDIVPRYLSHYSGQSYHCLVIIKYLANVLLMHQFRLQHKLLNDIPTICGWNRNIHPFLFQSISCCLEEQSFNSKKEFQM